MPIGQPNPSAVSVGYTGFGQSTPKQVPVTNGSTELLAANPNRLYAQVNNNGANPIWVQVGIDAVVGQGTKVSGGGGMLTFSGNELYKGQINAVAQNATVNTDVLEGV